MNKDETFTGKTKRIRQKNNEQKISEERIK